MNKTSLDAPFKLFPNQPLSQCIDYSENIANVNNLLLLSTEMTFFSWFNVTKDFPFPPFYSPLSLFLTFFVQCEQAVAQKYVPSFPIATFNDYLFMVIDFPTRVVLFLVGGGKGGRNGTILNMIQRIH
jgi:hypothetical protein